MSPIHPADIVADCRVFVTWGLIQIFIRFPNRETIYFQPQSSLLLRSHNILTLWSWLWYVAALGFPPIHSIPPDDFQPLIESDLGPFTMTPLASRVFGGSHEPNDIAADGARRARAHGKTSEPAILLNKLKKSLFLVMQPCPNSRLISKWKCPTL